MPLPRSGKNFSSGERQLLALARGLLKLKQGSNILLLDESTANLDAASDAAIQKTMTSQLAATTMLIIAHRLRTIIDADKVLMLDAGRVLEFDSPHALLQIEGGAFRDLCERSGEVCCTSFQLQKPSADPSSACSHRSTRPSSSSPSGRTRHGARRRMTFLPATPLERAPLSLRNLDEDDPMRLSLLAAKGKCTGRRGKDASTDKCRCESPARVWLGPPA